MRTRSHGIQHNLLDKTGDAGIADADPVLFPQIEVIGGNPLAILPDFEVVNRAERAVQEARAIGQWHLSNTGAGFDLNIVEAWRDYSGRGVTVAIFDDGVEAGHPDLARNYDASLEITGNNAAPDGTGADASGNPRDPHGTAVAGIVASALDGNGTVGVAFGATIVSVDREGLSDAAESLLMQELDRFDVVNCSFGNYEPFREGPDGSFAEGLAQAVKLGRDGLGTIVVKSGGNARALREDTGGTIDDVYADDGNTSLFVNSRYTLDVANVDRDGDVASSSTPGANLLVSAFGSGGIVTTDRVGMNGYNTNRSVVPGGALSGDYASDFGGTSAAAPMVSGIVALMLEANSDLGWRDVQSILALSARHVGDPVGVQPVYAPITPPGTPAEFAKYAWGFNRADNWNGGGMHFSNDYGFGLVDAHAAVRLAETWAAWSTSSNEKLAGGSWNSKKAATIADGLPGQQLANEFRFKVGGSIDIESIQLTLAIDHPRMSDLLIELRSPEGTTSILLDRAGLGGADVMAPYGGLVLTSNAFRGEISKGEWFVRIRDANTGLTDDGKASVGSVASVQLTAFGSQPLVNDVYFYTDEFAAMKAIDPARTELRDTDGGLDTINAAAVSHDVTLDLNAGAWNFIGSSYFTMAAKTVIEHAKGGDGNDTITGNSATNELHGNRGDDILRGKAGSDYLFGGEGNDILTGGAKGDWLNGGDGFDFASYQDATSAVVVNLADVKRNTGDAKGDTFISIEGVLGSSFADSLYGDAGNNELRGEDGNDYLDGGVGADTMKGGRGNDGYVVDHSGDRVIELAGEGTDVVYTTLTSYGLTDHVENLTFRGNGNVAFHGVGNAGDNAISSGYGDDLLEGGAGNDTLTSYGYLLGAYMSGNDTLDGGAGDDTMSGGDGSDIFLFADNWGNDVITDFAIGTDVLNMFAVSGLTDFGQLFITDVSGSTRIAYLGNTITLNGVNSISLMASSFLFAAPPAEQSFDGTAFWGGTISGGAGIDTVSYATASHAIYVDLQLGIARGGAHSAQLVSIENITGAADFANDLTGDAGDNILVGGSLGDWLRGRDGNNMLDGRGGYDVVDYSYDHHLAGVSVDLMAGKAVHFTGTDTLIGIEQVQLTKFDDVCVGSDLSDAILSFDGNDRLFGNGGIDVIDARDGDDFLDGGADMDYLYAGAGNDTVYGGEGDDFIVGEAGIDTLIGGAGADKFVFFSAAEGGDVIQDFTSGEDQIWLSGYHFGFTPGTLANAGVDFVTGAAATAHRATVIFDASTSTVLFDADGAGGAAAAVLAHLQAGVNLQAADVFVM
ncbi:MAG: S8 family serine peptidase [Pseudorhodoplanes sp.]|uniref:S8 family serine peptidase n=1 Tax=Pseudorhodoplanes sp. TaxID=1934341 RepID=UPI003D1498BE